MILSMGNVVSRDATALRTPSVYSVCSRLLPEAGCRLFSCTDNPIACGQPGSIAHLGAKCKKGPVHYGRIP